MAHWIRSRQSAIAFLPTETRKSVIGPTLSQRSMTETGVKADIYDVMPSPSKG